MGHEIAVPALGDQDSPGDKGGVPGGTVAPSQPVAIIAATAPDAPIKKLQSRWRPPSFLDFHTQLLRGPAQASRNLDMAIQLAFQNDSQLENMVSTTQVGQVTVTGSAKSISTGLVSVTQVTASIDNGATAHNFWVGASLSQQQGCIDIYVWQPTAAGNNTPTACTSPVTVRWIARGSLS